MAKEKEVAELRAKVRRLRDDFDGAIEENAFQK